MSHRKVQSRRGNLLVGVFTIIVSVVAIYDFIQITFVLITWLTKQAANIEPTVMAALITGAVTILSSVVISTYNAGRAQERAAEEANWGRKAEVYNEFILSLTRMMKSSEKNNGIDQEETAEFIAQFATQLMVYGGPDVIKAFGEWRTEGETASEARPQILLSVDKLLLAMREDLRVRNRGIEENELLGLIIIGGKPELDRLLGDA